MAKGTDYKVLKGERNFRFRICAQAAGRFGDSIDQIAFSWIMYEVTGSAALLALVLFFNYLPTILFQPFTGVLVERIPKKKVLVLCDLGRVLMVVLTIALYLLNVLNAPLLVLITLLVSTMEAFKLPASSAILPNILPKEKLQPAVACNSTVTRLFELLGSGAAGFLISLLGAGGALCVDAAGFLFSAVLNGKMNFTDMRDNQPLTPRRYFSQFSDGLKKLWSLKNVMILIAASALVNFSFAPINSYNSAYVSQNLRFGPEALSAMGVASSLGIALGCALSPKLQKYLRGRKLVFISGLTIAVNSAGLWLLPFVSFDFLRIVLLIADQTMMGLAVGVLIVPISSQIMASIPKEYLSRISAVSGAFQTATIPLGALLCSGLAMAMPVPWVFLLFGIFAFLCALLASRTKTFDTM